MPKFMLLARDVPQDFADLSPEEMQKIIEKYVAWGERLAAAGKNLDSNKLQDGTGRLLRRVNGKLAVTDGPFSETKEIIGGYWIIEADSYDEMQELVADCPHLEHGLLEIRQIEEVG